MLNMLALALLPTFLIMILGYAAGRLGRLGGDSVGALNTLVMEFALPAALFVGTATAPLDQIVRQAPAIPVLGIAMLVPFAAWYAYERKQGRDMGDAANLALPSPCRISPPGCAHLVQVAVDHFGCVGSRTGSHVDTDPQRRDHAIGVASLTTEWVESMDSIMAQKIIAAQ